MSANFIKQLNEDNGRLHKEDVLSKALTAAKLGNDISHRFLCYLKACYNPYETFGVKKIPDTIGITDAENPVDDFDQLLEDLAARRLTGHDARDAIQELAERFDSIEWNTFYAPVLRRDMRSGISVSTINKIVQGTNYEIPIFSCQLATNSEGRPEMRGTKRLEPKLDGVRVLMVVVAGLTSVVCYSRNGKVFENFSHIEDQIRSNASELVAAASKVTELQSGILRQGFVLDGEVVGNSFQELMRQARRKEDVNADDSVFHVFDILPLADFKRGYWNAQLSKRIALLEAMQPAFDKMPNAELLPHLMVDLDTHEGKNQLERYAKAMVAAGFEGIMIKNLEAPYICDRSTDWMKWKPTITVDLQVIGAEEGTGRNAGRLGALVCNGVDDDKEITVNVGSGYDDQFRAQIWADITGQPVEWKKKVKKDWVTMIEHPSGQNPIGRTAEILADAITQNRDGTYSLRFPRFIRFRDDKA
jgi:DNA ligase-1